MHPFLRPEPVLSAKEHLNTHHSTTISLAALEVLAAAGVLDRTELLAPIAPFSLSTSKLPTCEFTHVLQYPAASSVVWAGPVSAKAVAEARDGKEQENGPRADERLLLWALDGQDVDQQVRAHLVLQAVSRKMPWGLSGLLNGWTPEAAAPVQKALQEALANAIEIDQPALIVPLLKHALEHKWTSPGNLVREAKGPTGAKAIIQVIETTLSPDQSVQQWQEWTRQWHWDMALTLGLLRFSNTTSWQKEREALRKLVSPHLLDWAIEKLQHKPEHAQSLGQVTVARLMAADNAEFKIAVEAYAHHWKTKNWSPDQHFPLGLAGTLMALPLLKDKPGRRMHRILEISSQLEKHQVGTAEQRRAVQAQLHWLQEGLLPFITDAFHHERAREIAAKIQLTDQERLTALNTFSTKGFKPVTANSYKFQAIPARSIAKAALRWSFEPETPGEKMAEVWTAVHAVLENSQDTLVLSNGNEPNVISPAQWNQWMRTLADQVTSGQTHPAGLVAPLLNLADKLSPMVRVLPEEHEAVWAQASAAPADTDDVRTTLVRTLKVLAEHGGQYTVGMDETHRLYPIHDYLREAHLRAVLPTPKPSRRGPRF